MFRKICILLLATVLTLSSFLMRPLPLKAEEYSDEDGSITTITELGSDFYEIFPQFRPKEDPGNKPMLRDSGGQSTLGTPYAFIYIDNWRGFDWVAHLTVGDKTVFCIEPMVDFVSGQWYEEDTTKWEELSRQQQHDIWLANYYGYSYPGHENPKYYVATQLLIWQIVTGKWYAPYEMDETTPYDISAELAEIERLKNSPQGRPSFAGSTVKTGLNMPVTLTDTKGVLGNFSMPSPRGLSLSRNGNDLTITITSEDHEKDLQFGTMADARSVNIIYGSGGYQKVIYLASRSDPTANFSLRVELQYADINIKKQDKETGNTPQGDARFSGAEFTVKDASGNVLETVTSSEDSVLTKKYPVGKPLTITETKAPEGYLLKEESISAPMNENKDRFEVTVEDQVIKGKIEIAKTVEQEREYPAESVISVPGVGFVFDIYLKSSGELVTTLTTDEEGRAMSELLPYGTYEVKEREKEGYVTLKPFDVKIEEDQKVYFYNIYNDGFKADVTIYKTDAETGKRIPAAGVSFKIKDEEGNILSYWINYPKRIETDTFVTDEEGSVHLPEPLAYGKYYLVEINAPYGYVLSGEEIPLNIDGEATEIFKEFPNKAQKGQIVIEKYGEMLKGFNEEETEYGTLYTPVYEKQYLEDAVFGIYAAEEIRGEEGTLWFEEGELADTVTTSSEKTVTKELPLGRYFVKEISAPAGFVLDQNEYEVTLEYAGQETEITTKQLGINDERQKLDLLLQKLFEEEVKDAYKDVLFGVFTEEEFDFGEEETLPKDSLVALLKIDDKGKIESADLPAGKYYLKELKTNAAFELNEETVSFEFAYSEDQSEATVTVKAGPFLNNKRRIDLEVTKVDKDDHSVLLNGAVFEVRDLTAGKELGILVSGKLAFRGTAVGEEYEIADNEEFSGVLRKAKTDAQKEIVLNVPAGTYYLRKCRSEDVTKLIVADGKAVLADAVYGHEYRFTEIDAPASYDKAAEPKTFRAEGSDKAVYVFENKRTEVPNTGIAE